jgi:mRNA-degrading endonuclease RelE of RelBE toxin-antitoxin system
MWKLRIHSKAAKALKALPVPAQKAFAQLVFDLRANGPVAGNWPNYGKLGRDKHHCHLKKGRPTYVSVWREIKDDAEKIIEVIYVGTHEKAPY